MLSSADDLQIVGEADDGVRRGRRRPGAPARRRADGHPHARDGRHHRDGRAVPARPAPQVIVLTTYQADEQVISALRAGAAGFLLKHTPPAEFVRAVRLVASGEAMLSPSVTRTLLSHFADTRARTAAGPLRDASPCSPIASATSPSPSASGAPNAEIAAGLFMSEATVKTHVSRLLTKLDVTNRVHIAIVVHDAEHAWKRERSHGNVCTLITRLFCPSRSATSHSASAGLLLASQIAAVLDIPPVEIDVLCRGRSWTPRPSFAEMRRLPPSAHRGSPQHRLVPLLDDAHLPQQEGERQASSGTTDRHQAEPCLPSTGAGLSPSPGAIQGIGAPGRDRTCDRRIRSVTDRVDSGLLPAALLAVDQPGAARVALIGAGSCHVSCHARPDH